MAVVGPAKGEVHLEGHASAEAAAAHGICHPTKLHFARYVGADLHDADPEDPDRLPLPGRLLGREGRAQAARARAPPGPAGAAPARAAPLGGTTAAAPPALARRPAHAARSDEAHQSGAS